MRRCSSPFCRWSARWSGCALGFALATLTALALAQAARAQTGPHSDDERARARWESGRAHYQAGRVTEALADFEAAYTLSGRAALLYDVYLCRLDLGDVAPAAEALRRYLAEATIDPGERPGLTARLAVLERRVAEREAVAPQRVRASERAREQARPRAPRVLDVRQPATRGPNVAAWTVVSSGAAAVIAGAVLLVVAQADIASVEGGSRWSEVEGSYRRAPVASGVGFGALGVGLAALGTGALWLVAEAP